MSEFLHWSTFREIDEQNSLAKGSAFRAFKQIEPRLKEKEDFQLLRAENDTDSIERLRSLGRIYRSSRNVVLLSPESTQQVLEILRCG